MSSHNSIIEKGNGVIDDYTVFCSSHYSFLMNVEQNLSYSTY
jgi:hypothetical protein